MYDKDPTKTYMNAIIQYMKFIWTDWLDYDEFKNEPEGQEALEALKQELLAEETRTNLLLTDKLMKSLIESHFSVNGKIDLEAYFDAIEKFALDVYQIDNDRDIRISDPNDERKVYAKYHRMDGEKLWFIWAGQCEWSSMIDQNNSEYGEIRKLQLAGAVYGVSLDYTCRNDRTAKPKKIPIERRFKPNERTLKLLRKRAYKWFIDFDRTKNKIHDLYQIYQS